MKIRLGYILCAVLVSFSTTLRSQILVGPVVGTGISWVRFHEKESRKFYKQTPVPGWMGGVDVSFMVRKSFYMHTALIYSRKGKRLTSDQSPDLKQKEVDHHIDMPILFTHEFKVKMGRYKVVKLYAGIGPNLSYWLGGRGTLNTSQLLEDGYPPIRYRIGFKEDAGNPSVATVHGANRLQLGLNISLGADFEPWGYHKVYVNLRYELGHSYLAKGGPTTFPGVNDYSDDVQARNMGLRLSAAYLIDLKTSERKKGKSTMDRVMKKKR